MIFKTNGFVHTDQPAHFVSETSFQLDKDLSSLIFEFFGSGKQPFFHVEDPSGLLRVQHQSSAKPSKVLLHADKTKSGIGTFPGKIQKGHIILKKFEPESSESLDEKWLSGDFHVHSRLSDGSATTMELLDEGKSKKLDFFLFQSTDFSRL